jgi:DMSO/TMAO reductase YedYZ molybdopterin-dependent catalytic subunit
VTTTEQPPAAASAPDVPPRHGRRPLAAVAGLLSAGVALAVAELVAGLVGPQSSPVVAVGDTVITFVPEPVKALAIRTFGEDDKTALVAGTLAVTALYAAVLGVLALRRRAFGIAGIVLFGLVGGAAAVTGPAGGPLDALPALAGALAGTVALLALLAPLTVPAGGPTDTRPDDGAPLAERLRTALGSGDRKGAGLDRRRFFLAGSAAVGAAVVTGGAGRLLLRRFDVGRARADLALPAPASPAAPLPAGADLAERVEGLTPLFTANREFYRVDTAITVPQIDPAEYRLTLTGMFDSPRSYTLDDLLRRDDVVERDITLTCVSNTVGGRLAGTARWLGIPLGAFLRENGIRSGSEQLVCRSSDGMTIGAPTRSALEVEDAMIAFGMNGEPLPVEYGFPVRMVIPGLYGYVSACKWMTGIEAATYDAFDAYWTERDWAAQAPIKVSARIDTPAPLRRFPAGRRPIAGVAWAQTRGISAVEVRIDEGPWRLAQLSSQVDADLWRQWVLPHDFAPGSYQLTVRATSADGEVQTEERAEPFPDGASGLHSIRVTAT